MSKALKSNELPANMPKWKKLQIVIFTRWVNQRIANTGLHIKNCVKDMSAEVLVALLENLSGKKFAGKLKAGSSKIVKVDNLNLALKFVNTCGKMNTINIKPSVENMYDGEEIPVLGFIWMIMINFLKIETGDDEVPVSATEALLMWLQNQVKNYKGVNVKNLTTSWHDGLAFCALLHKHRPNLIGDFDALKKEDWKNNLNTAYKAANEYFDLEEFLAPEDIRDLDEKSMVIYLSEYYHGIYRMRKMEIASKRIHKFVCMLEKNDQLREQYNKVASELKSELADAIKILDDRTIDNTMEGAVKKLEEFNKFKITQKTKIVNDFLSIEAVYNVLATRLSDHHCPPYNPEGLMFADFRKDFLSLESRENERGKALLDERNRQIRLKKLDEQHSELVSKVLEWSSEKKAWIETKVDAKISDVAETELEKVRSFIKELDNITEMRANKQFGQIVNELDENKYENIKNVKTRQDGLVSNLKDLKSQALEVESDREDDVKRLQFIEMLRLKEQQHSAMGNVLQQWNNEKKSMLDEISNQEDLSIISNVQLQIQRVSRMLIEQKDKVEQTTALKTLGSEILGLKYTGKTTASCSDPDAIKSLESSVDNDLETLSKTGNELAIFLDDKLKQLFDNDVLESLKANLAVQNEQHVSRFEDFISFFNQKDEFLAIRENMDEIKNNFTWTDEEIKSALEAIEALNGCTIEIKARRGRADGLVEFGKRLQIIEHHNKGINWANDYVCEFKDEIQNRHDQLAPRFLKLDEAAKERKEFLDNRLENLRDNKARSEWLEHVNLRAKEHEKNFKSLEENFNEWKNYLNEIEDINTLAAARMALNSLDQCINEIKNLALLSNQLQEEGKRIQGEKRESKFSVTKYENPQQIDDYHKTLNDLLKEVNELATTVKGPRLKKALERELHKCDLRLRYSIQIAEGARYCRMQEEISSTMHFGYTLEEVQASEKVLKDMDQNIASQKEDFTKKLGVLDQERETIEGCGPDFWEERTESWTAACTALDEAINVRNAAYKTELEKQLANDALCKKFADLANPLISGLNTKKDEIVTKGEIEKQFAFVNQLLESKNDIGKDLPTIEELQKQIDAADITRNRHSLHSYSDVQVQWAQFLDFIERKKGQLAEEIEHKLRRGVTDEQLNEIKTQWERFDVNKNNMMDKKELRNLFFSVGEDRTATEISDIMKKYGADPKLGMNFDQFKDFMIDQLGDIDTPESIAQGFQLLNNGASVAYEESLKKILSANDVAYLISHLPKNKDDRYDYNAYLKQVFM